VATPLSGTGISASLSRLLAGLKLAAVPGDSIGLTIGFLRADASIDHTILDVGILLDTSGLGSSGGPVFNPANISLTDSTGNTDPELDFQFTVVASAANPLDPANSDTEIVAGTGSVQVSGNPLSPSVVVNTNFNDLFSGFTNLTPADIVSSIGNIASWLDEIRKGETLSSISIPFVKGGLDKVLDLAGILSESLLFSTGADQTKDSTDRLVTDINNALARADLADSLRAVGNGETFTLFAIDSAIGDFSIEAPLPATLASGNWESVVGNDGRAAIADISAVDGEVTADFSVTLSVEGLEDNVTFTVTEDDAGNNTGLGDDTPKLVDASGTPTFTSLQQLAERLAQIFANEAGSFSIVDDVTFADNKLLLNISTGELAVPAIELPADFEIDLSPLGEITSETRLVITASGGIDLALGYDLGEITGNELTDQTTLEDLEVTVKQSPAVTAQETPRTIFGQLENDVAFQIAIGNSPAVAVTLEAIATESNTEVSDLLGQLNNALANALNPQVVEAIELDDILQLSSQHPFTVTTESGNAAFRELGLQASGASFLGDNGISQLVEGGPFPKKVGQLGSDQEFTLELSLDSQLFPIDVIVAQTSTVPNPQTGTSGNRNVLDLSADVQLAIDAEFENYRRPITGITQANPVEVTLAELSEFQVGMPVKIANVTGMEELNDTDENGRIFRITAINGTTLTLGELDGNSLDGTGLSAYGDGGTVSLGFEMVVSSTTGKLLFTLEAPSTSTFAVTGAGSAADLGITGTLPDSVTGLDLRSDLKITLSGQEVHYITLDDANNIGDVIDQLVEGTGGTAPGPPRVPGDLYVTYLTDQADTPADEAARGLLLLDLTSEGGWTTAANLHATDFSDGLTTIVATDSLFGGITSDDLNASLGTPQLHLLLEEATGFRPGLYEIAERLDSNTITIRGRAVESVLDQNGAVVEYLTPESGLGVFQNKSTSTGTFRIDAVNGSLAGVQLGLIGFDKNPIDKDDIPDGKFEGAAIQGTTIADRLFITGYDPASSSRTLDRILHATADVSAGRLITGITVHQSNNGEIYITADQIFTEQVVGLSLSFSNVNGFSSAAYEITGVKQDAEERITGLILANPGTLPPEGTNSGQATLQTGVNLSADFGFVGAQLTGQAATGLELELGLNLNHAEINNDQLTFASISDILSSDDPGSQLVGAEGLLAPPLLTPAPPALPEGAGSLPNYGGFDLELQLRAGSTDFTSMAGELLGATPPSANFNVVTIGDPFIETRFLQANYQHISATTFTLDDPGNRFTNLLTASGPTGNPETLQLQFRDTTDNAPVNVRISTVSHNNDITTVSVSSTDEAGNDFTLPTQEELENIRDVALRPAVTFDTSGLTGLQLPNFSEISFSQILGGLRQLSDFLGEFESFTFLDSDLPLVDVSLNDLLGYVERFNTAVEEVEKNPSGTLQTLEDKINEAIGINLTDLNDVYTFLGQENPRPPKVIEAVTAPATGPFVVTFDQDHELLSGMQLSIDGVDGLLDDESNSLLNGKTFTVETVNGQPTQVTLLNTEDMSASVEYDSGGLAQLAGNDVVDLTYSEGVLKIDFTLGATISKELDIRIPDIEFGSGVFSALLGDGDEEESILEITGSANLVAQGAMLMTLSLGIDLRDVSDDSVSLPLYIYDTTGLEAKVEVAGEDLAFRAGLGPLALAIASNDQHSSEIRIAATGRVGFAETVFNDSNLPASVPADAATFASLLTALNTEDTSTTEVSLGGSISGTLPVFFPTDTNYIGNIVIGGSDDDGTFTPSGDLAALTGTSALAVKTQADDLLENNKIVIDVSQVVEYVSGFDFSRLDIFNQIFLAIDGVDLILEGVQDVLEGDIGNTTIPLVGGQLSKGASFISDFREDLIGPLREGVETAQNLAIDFASPEKNVVSLLLYDLLGPEGAGLLEGSISEAIELEAETLEHYLTPSDDSPDVNMNDVFIEWDMTLEGNLVDESFGINFDLGIPGIGLETEGDIDVDIRWQFHLVFGLSFADGFYLRIGEEDRSAEEQLPELVFDVSVSTDSLEATGRLAFLELNATNSVDGEGTTLPTQLAATFVVDIFEQGAVDLEDASKLTFSEIGQMGFIPALAATAETTLDLELGINQELVGSAASGFPSILGRLELLWELGERETSEGSVASEDEVSLSELGRHSTFISLRTIDGSESNPFLAKYSGDPISNAIADGLKKVGIYNIQLDVGDFLTNVMGPVVDEVSKFTKPLQPIVDFVTSPVPIIGQFMDFTWLDLADTYGKVDTRLIRQIAEVVTLINDIADSAGASLLIPIGDFVYYDAESGSNPATPAALANPDTNPEDLDTPTPTTSSVENELDSQSDDSSGTEQATKNNKAKRTMSSLLKQHGTFSFPFLTDPSQIFGLLQGKTATLVQYDIKPLTLEFNFSRFFPIYGPLGVSVGLNASVTFDSAVGYDTSGIQRFVDTGARNPVYLLDGFYIDDSPQANGVDDPELVFNAALTAAAELNLGIASAGVRASLGFRIEFDLFDPNRDGKVRVSELIGNFTNQTYAPGAGAALAPLAIFDVRGEVYALLDAYLNIHFLFFTASFEFPIYGPVTLLDYSIDFFRPPIFATELDDGDLLVHTGKFAEQRLLGIATDVAENIEIRATSSNGVATVSFRALDNALGSDATTFVRDYTVSSNHRILIDGGLGDDRFDLSNFNAPGIQLVIDLGVGDDVVLGAGANTLGITNVFNIFRGQEGDDTIYGTGGADLIFGGPGKDSIYSLAGPDLIFGDNGELARYSLAAGIRKNSDDGDILHGGDGDDILFGGGEKDILYGNDGNDLLIGGGADLLFDEEIAYPIAGVPSRLEPDTAFQLVANLLPLELDGAKQTESALEASAGDTLFGGAGNDILIGTAGPDILYGGDGRDTVIGNSGPDDIQGNGDSDILFGDKGMLTEIVAKNTSTGGSATVLTDSAASFQTNGVRTGDFVRNRVTQEFSRILTVPSETELTLEASSTNASWTTTNYSIFRASAPAGGVADLLDGGLGDDLLLGGDGSDIMQGGPGNDELQGGAGADFLFGDSGTMITVPGGRQEASPTDRADDGNDTLLGQGEADKLFGNGGIDVLDGGIGSDQIMAGPGDDAIFATKGDDYLDGNDGNDTYRITFQGGSNPSLVTVNDTGGLSGIDLFYTSGTIFADEFLLRTNSDGSIAFVALVKVTKTTVTGDPQVLKTGVGDIERIDYRGVERIVVNGGAGDDYFASDDTASEVTLNGETGDDRFQVGQLFRTARTEVNARIAFQDQFATIQTTRGYLSNGISSPMTINGGLGEDNFVVYHNRAVLTLNGDQGDDIFEVRAFALVGSQEPQRERTDVTGGAGADLVQYAINAPVNINGGDGTDTLVVVGTEFGDDFVITENGVFGAGLTINFVNIEILRIDGAEGNDRFFVQSTKETFLTEIFGGLGEDTFNMSGDTPPVVSNDLLGHSGIVTHSIESTDSLFDGQSIFGLSANVADNDEPAIVLRETIGSSIITEGQSEGDSYTVFLTRPPMTDVFVQALAPVPAPVDREKRAQAFRLSSTAPEAAVTANGTGLTLRFTPLNWYIPQTVQIAADAHILEDNSAIFTRPELGDGSGASNIAFDMDDDAYEGPRSGMINHVIQAGTVSFDGNPIEVGGLTQQDAISYSSLDFDDNDGAAPSITREDPGGSWIEDGFIDDSWIDISNSDNHNGTYQLQAVTASTLTLSTDAVITDATEVANVAINILVDLTFDEVPDGPDRIERNIGSWSDDGFLAGGFIEIADSGRNDGFYQIGQVINDTELELADTDQLVNAIDVLNARISTNHMTIPRPQDIDPQETLGRNIQIVSGSGVGQSRLITSVTVPAGTTDRLQLTIDRPWSAREPPEPITYTGTSLTQNHVYTGNTLSFDFPVSGNEIDFDAQLVINAEADIDNSGEYLDFSIGVTTERLFDDRGSFRRSATLGISTDTFRSAIQPIAPDPNAIPPDNVTSYYLTVHVTPTTGGRRYGLDYVDDYLRNHGTLTMQLRVPIPLSTYLVRIDDAFTGTMSSFNEQPGGLPDDASFTTSPDPRSTFTDSTASFPRQADGSSALRGATLKIAGGPGAGQERLVLDHRISSTVTTHNIVDVSTGPVTLTFAAEHHLRNNDRIQVDSVLGTEQLNGNSYRVTTIPQEPTRVLLADVDGTALTPYTSDGTASHTAFSTLVLNSPWTTDPRAGESVYRIQQYDGLTIPSLEVKIHDNDVPGLIVDETKSYLPLADPADQVITDFDTVTSVIEGSDGDQLGEHDVLRVRLSKEPAVTTNIEFDINQGVSPIPGEPQLQLSRSDSTALTDPATGQAVNTLTFTPANWDQFQDVHVTPDNDQTREGFHVRRIDMTILEDASGASKDQLQPAGSDINPFDEFNIPSSEPVFIVGLSQSPFDSQGFVLTTSSDNPLVDGTTFSIHDNTGSETVYEFDNDGNTQPETIAIAFDGTTTQTEVAARIVTALNSTANLGVTARARTSNENERIILTGLDLTSSLTSGSLPLAVSGLTGGNVAVWHNGIRLRPGVDYDVEGNKVSFLEDGEPQSLGGLIDVDYLHIRPGYDSADIESVVARLADDDSPGVIVREGGGSTDVVEYTDLISQHYFAQSRYDSGHVYEGNTIVFDFDLGEIMPIGDATLTVSAIADLDLDVEYLATTIQGTSPAQTTDLFSTFVPIPPHSYTRISAQETILIPLEQIVEAKDAENGHLIFHIQPSFAVNNYGPTSLTFQLEFLAAEPASNVFDAGDFYEVVLTAPPILSPGASGQEAYAEITLVPTITKTTRTGGIVYKSNQLTLTGSDARITPAGDEIVVRFGPDDWDTPVQIQVVAIDDAVVDGGDTKEFAPHPHTLSGIVGPVSIEGGVGRSSLDVLGPLLLTEETNVKPSVGSVLEVTDDGTTSEVTVLVEDLYRAIQTQPAYDRFLSATNLVEQSVEVTSVRSGEEDDPLVSQVGQISSMTDPAETSTDYDILAATNTNPVVITVSTDHELTSDTRVVITAVDGMSELNDRSYLARPVPSEPRQLTLLDVDGTLFTPYSDGGTGTVSGAAPPMALSGIEITETVTLSFNQAHDYTTGMVIYLSGTSGIPGINSQHYTVTEIPGDPTRLELDYELPVLSGDFSTLEITAISQDNPVQVTFSSPHAFPTDQNTQIFIDGIQGMTELNGDFYQAQSVEAAPLQVTLLGVDGSGNQAYVAGGTARGTVQAASRLRLGQSFRLNEGQTLDDIDGFTISPESPTLFVDEAVQVDVMFIHDTDSPADSTGILTSTRLYGLNMGPDVRIGDQMQSGGITYHDLEVVDIQLGTGNNTFEVRGTHTRETDPNYKTWTILKTGNDLVDRNHPLIEPGDTVTITLQKDAIESHATGTILSFPIPSPDNEYRAQAIIAESFTDGSLEGFLLTAEGDGVRITRRVIGNSGSTLQLEATFPEDDLSSLTSYILSRPADGAFAVNTQGGNDTVLAANSSLGVVIIAGEGSDEVISGSGDDHIFGDKGRIDYLKSAIGDPREVVTRLGDYPEPILGDTVTLNPNRTVLTDTDASFPVPAGNAPGLTGLYVDINDGTGFLELPRLIIDNTAISLTVSPAFNVDLDETSTYRISTVPESQTDGLHYPSQEHFSFLWSDPGTDSTDTIEAGSGTNIVFGSNGADVITSGENSTNIIFGDDGYSYLSAGDGDGSLTATTSHAVTAITEKSGQGAADTITLADGTSSVIGGAAGDIIQIGNGTNHVLADEGRLEYIDSLLVSATSQNTSIGGRDTVTIAGGANLVIAGADQDTIDIIAAQAADDRAVVLGDSGEAIFLDNVLQRATTLAPGIGDSDTITVTTNNNTVIGGAADDMITVGGGINRVIGDAGEVNLPTTGDQTVRSIDPTIGGADLITVQGGVNYVIGGFLGDTIQGIPAAGLTEPQIFGLGDNGIMTFNAAGFLTQITSTDVCIAGDDTFQLADSDDVIVAGMGIDTVNIDRTSTATLGSNGGNDILLGDNGEITFVTSASDSQPFSVLTTSPECSSPDQIFGGNDNDVILGGGDNDTLNAGTDAGNDLVFGDHGYVLYDGDAVSSLVDTATSDLTVGGAALSATDLGGVDTISTFAGNDVIIGGADSDILLAGDDDDHVLGDNGSINLTSHLDTSFTTQTAGIPSEVRVIHPTIGAADEIHGGAGHDIIFGGTGGDEIHGGADHDILLGDHGLFADTRPRNQPVTSIFIDDQQGAGNDTIFGDAGDDFLMGQQGQDTLHGGLDEDDITGGHNVLTGHDDNDLIHGDTAGDIASGDADVILGDNGVIERELTSLSSPDTWTEYPAPFIDVIRTITRYDDIDTVTGNDTIHAGGGDDIVHGQRGEDTIHGDNGDDELLGELGNDIIHAGAGNDTALGDGGGILRDYVDPQTPRRNANGSWHRDVILQDYGSITQIIPLSRLADVSEETELAEHLVSSDLILLANAYTAQEQLSTRASDAGTTFETFAVLVDTFEPNDDQVFGGSGDDVLVGQRGDDVLDGALGDDLVLGDNARFASGFTTQTPTIVSGIRLYGDAATGLEIPDGGTFVNIPMVISPEALNYNSAFPNRFHLSTISQHEVSELISHLGDGILRRIQVGGSVMAITPLAAIIPRVVGHLDVLDGNDHLTGGDGDDWVFADAASLHTSALSGIPAVDLLAKDIDLAIQRLQHSLGRLGLDYQQSSENGGTVDDPQLLSFANDHVYGDGSLSVNAEGLVSHQESPAGGNDILVGDVATTLTDIRMGLPSQASLANRNVFHMLDYLDGLRTAFSDLESIVFHAHTDTLRAMAAVAEEGTDRTSPNYFQIEFGLDQLDGDAGDDVIIGDDAFLILPTVGQGQFANAANNATFNVASRLELFANYRSTLDSQFIQHVNMDHPASLSEVSDSLLQQVAWDHDYPLTTGNDEISGDTGDDVIVGDFSIYATPIINHETVAALLDAHQETHPENSPAANCALQAATVEEQLACMSDDSDLEFQLRTAIEELNKDIIEYMEYGRHAVDHYRELEATYLHPYYGHRSEGQQLTLAEMGKDILHGDSGADFIIGDSISLYTVTVASDGQAITLAEISDNLSSNRDPKLETRFMHRGTFEHQDRYLLIATEADLLDGGEGNDILFGQYMDDQLTGAEGVDVLYGGSGTNVLSPDASDDPHQVRTVSDDRPKLQNLTALKSGYQASHQRVADTLAVDMSEDRTLTTGQELPFDVKTGSLMVSRETVRWSTYRSRHNAVQPNDVNNDGTISPIDALQVITILNQMLTVESAVTFGGLGYLSDQALDVSNDSVVSPMDALLVINYLNSVTDGEGEGEPGFDFRAPQAFPPQQLLHSESRPSRPVARISPAGTSRHEVRQQLATRACHIQRSSMDDKVKLHRADRFTPAPSDHEFHQGILAELLDDEIFLCHPNLLP